MHESVININKKNLPILINSNQFQNFNDKDTFTMVLNKDGIYVHKQKFFKKFKNIFNEKLENILFDGMETDNIIELVKNRKGEYVPKNKFYKV